MIFSEMATSSNQEDGDAGDVTNENSKANDLTEHRPNQNASTIDSLSAIEVKNETTNLP